MSDDARKRITPRVPHYSLSTLASSAPEYLNHEQDVIRQAFHRGNYTYMKERVPSKFAPNSITFFRRKRMDQVRTGTYFRREPLTWAKMTGKWGGSCYRYENIPDPYDAEHQGRIALTKWHKEAQSSLGHSTDWRPASQNCRLKYEPLVVSKEELKDPRAKEVPAFIGSQYSEAELLDNSGPVALVLQPSFRTGRGSGLNDEGKMSRVGIRSQVTQKLQEKLDEEWDDATVVVSVTELDMVQIAFLLSTIDSEHGLHAYMNILAKDCEIVNSLGLRKMSQLWGVTRTFSKTGQSLMSSQDDPGLTWMFFLLSPKWVRMRNTDAFYTRHPRAQGSQFRMSKAGSSVLLSLGPETTPRDSLSLAEKTIKESPRDAEAEDSFTGALPSVKVPGKGKKNTSAAHGKKSQQRTKWSVQSVYQRFK